MNKIRLFVLSLAAMIGWATFGAIAYAVDAATTTALNLRSGPGTSYGVIDVLSSGEIVSIVECQGSWCYVSQADGGPSGWVSSNYLTTAPDAPAPDDPDCSFALTFGPGGPSLSIVCGDADIPVPVPTPTPTPPRACLYKNTNYGGGGVCYGPGTINQLGANMNDKTSSVKLQGGATVRLCVNANLGGFCRNVTTNEAALGGLLNNRVSSIRVYAGAAPAPVPRACLYTNTNFGGTGVCYGVGTTNALAGNMNDKASSIRLQAGATARV